MKKITFLLVSLLTLIIYRGSAQDSTTYGFSTQPYLQNFTGESISIFAVFNKPSLAWLEILDGNNKVIDTIYQVEDGMRNANAELFKFKYQHKGTNFNYRIVGKEVKRFDPYKIEYGDEIKTRIITTKLSFSDQEISVYVLNDVHGKVKTYSDLLDDTRLNNANLIFINGDAFDYIVTKEDVILQLLKPVSEVFASEIPFVMVRGNHETRGKFARDFKSYFDFPENKFYQSFTQGGIHWIVLDGGEDKPDSHPVYGGTTDYDDYRLEQRAWLKNILQFESSKSSKYTIVVNHIPFFHSDDWHGTLHNRSCFHDLLQAGQVTALISGHTHEYGFHAADEDHNYAVFIGGSPKDGQRTVVRIAKGNANLEIHLLRDDGVSVGAFHDNK